MEKLCFSANTFCKEILQFETFKYIGYDLE